MLFNIAGESNANKCKGTDIKKSWKRGEEKNSNTILGSLQERLVTYVSADGQTKGLYTRPAEIRFS